MRKILLVPGSLAGIVVPMTAAPLVRGDGGPRRPGAVYGEGSRVPDVMAVVGALRAGRPIPPTPRYRA